MKVKNYFTYLLPEKKKNLILSILLLLPAFSIYVVLLLLPIGQSVYMSFFKWNGIPQVPMKYVGFRNFTGIFRNQHFWVAMRNSIYFMIGGFGFLMPLSFSLALIITSKLKFTKFFKTVYFIPVILPITVNALIWSYVLEPNWGLVNSLFKLNINWLGRPDLNIWMVILVNEWIYAGFNMLIFASGIISIDESIYEAAIIDGATGWKKLRYITIPLCKESFKIFSVICVTGCLKHFDLVFAMTRGGPNHASEMPATLLYKEAFEYRNFGTANAVATIILILSLISSIILNRYLTQEDL